MGDEGGAEDQEEKSERIKTGELSSAQMGTDGGRNQDVKRIRMVGKQKVKNCGQDGTARNCLDGPESCFSISCQKSGW